MAGYEDEVWWSRVTPPTVRAWTEADRPLRLVEQAVPKGEPQALACYGVLARRWDAAGRHEEAWLRFVDGRPVGGLTTRFLAWCTERLAARGTRVLVLIWDNASWHLSREVRGWLRAHNQRAHREGGVRIVPCWLPVKSPWLNPIEPQWVHAQRKVVEPARRLPAAELEERVCAVFGCAQLAHLALPQEVA